MRRAIKYFGLLLLILGISSCQNSTPQPHHTKGLSTSSTKAVDSSDPLTVIGGELTYDLITTIQSDYELYGIKFNPKNNTIIAYGDSSILTIYNLDMQVIASIKSKNDEINAIDISPDGNTLVCGGDDGYIEIWDLNTYQLRHRMQSNADDTFAVVFSSDNKKVASGGEERVIDVWDSHSGDQIARLEGHQDTITDLSFIDYNRKIVSTSADKQTKIWDVTKKRVVYSYLAPSNEYGKIMRAKSFDDYTILALTEVERATGNSRRRNGPPVWKYSIKFKDNQGNTLQEFDGHRGSITDIDVASNRSYMASSSEDNTIRLWDLEKKKHITNIVLKERGEGVTINRSGHLLAALEGEKRIKLFQIKSSYSPSLTPSHSAPVSSVGESKIDSSWYNHQYAIVVGIDHYKRLSLPRLNNAVKDARSIAAILRKKGFSVIELYNENATKERILDALKKIKQLSTSQDATLFYFAGHGDGVSGYNNVREGYILPYDFGSDLNNPNTDVMQYDRSALSISSLVMYSRDTKAKHIGIILDSCFSGLAMESKYTNKSLLSSNAKALDHVEYDSKTRSVRIKPTTSITTQSESSNNEVNKLFRELLSKKSINILTAGDDQPVLDGTQHSPFTQALLEVLDNNINKGGYIRFSTLADYIKKYVEKRTQQQQKPQYKNESLEDGDFIFKL
jgi:WD40 repeat protein